MDRKIRLLGLDVDGTLITPDQRVPSDVIEAIYGEFILAEEELSVRVKRLWGTLRIPGATRVFVDDCNGTIYQSDQAHVRIKESNLRCKQRPY